MASLRGPDLDLLASAGWLAETPPGFRDVVLDRCSIRRHGRGEAVYRAGDPPGGLFGLIRGGVGIELAPSDREPYIGTFARPGFWIGEGSVLTRGPRFIGVRAVRDSLFAYLSLAEWEAIVRSDPEAWRWLAHLSLRNALLAMSVADALMVAGATERMAAILLVLAEQNLATGPGPAVTLEISQEDLARMANLSRSSAGRILQQLEMLGLLHLGYRQVRLIDHDGLRAYKAGL